MKTNMVKILKAVVVSMMALVMVAVGTLNVPADAEAAESVKTTSDAPEDNGVIYVQYSNLDPTEYWDAKKAPQYTGVDSNGVGYLFGGWYTKKDNTYTAVDKKENLTGTVVAKFVPAQTMSVKCQNWAGTQEGSSDVIIRVISATDNTNYSNFGFQVSKIVNGVETKFQDYTTDTVYKKFKYYESTSDTEPDTYTPSQLFGDAASRFTTCTVGKIPADMHGAIICLKPFWVTLDGTTVYGLAKYAHVEDGYLHYVNVPVNLNILSENSGAAAGYLSVQSNDSLEFLGAEKGVECGRVFDEMDFNVITDAEGKTIIKCVGNTSDISDKDEMDIYINLRFLRKEADQGSDKPIADNFYTFTVNGEHFSSSAEEALDNLDVWNIIY